MSLINELFDQVAETMRKVDRDVKAAQSLFRCEAYRTFPMDVTGENAQQCGMIAGYFCENCHLLLCDHDAEEPCTVYPYEHKILEAGKSEVA